MTDARYGHCNFFNVPLRQRNVPPRSVMLVCTMPFSKSSTWTTVVLSASCQQIMKIAGRMGVTAIRTVSEVPLQGPSHEASTHDCFPLHTILRLLGNESKVHVFQAILFQEMLPTR